MYRWKQLSNIPTQKTLQPIIGVESSLESVLIEVIDPEDKPSDVGQGQRLRILASPMTKAVYFFSLPRAMERGPWLLLGLGSKWKTKKEELHQPDLRWSGEKLKGDKRGDDGGYLFQTTVLWLNLKARQQHAYYGLHVMTAMAKQCNLSLFWPSSIVHHFIMQVTEFQSVGPG